MKKTLVALAVLAASGASFAQVTITGNLNMGYRASKIGGADASGFGIRDSNVTFGFTEDMGAGMSMAGQVKIDSLNRAGVGGGDAFLKLSNRAGYMKLGTAEIDSDLNEISSNLVDLYMDNLVGGGFAVGGASSYYNNADLVHDFVEFGTTFGPVAVSFAHYEGATGYSTGIGLGAGAAGSKLQRENLFKAVYSAGNLTAEASYGAYDNKDSAAVMQASLDTVTTIAGNYNFGVVAVGGGYQKTSYSNGNAQETALQVSVPLGALTLGLALDSAKIDSAGLNPTADGTVNGSGIVATYALSKRTSVRALYMSYDPVTSPAEKDTRTEVVLKHTF
jgi:hypothetical protein